MRADKDEIAILVAETSRISELIRSCDLATPVAHLGRWKIRDVAGHLGGVHRWAARIVRTRSADGPGFVKSKLDGLELCDWFDAGASELLDAFRSNDRHEACPNFNPGSANTVAWWLRRQVHETTVHRWDIERALECTTPIDSTVAADGVDEFLDVFVRTRGKQRLVAPLLLSSTRPKRSWTLTPARKPGRVDIDADIVVDGSLRPKAELSGPPDDLLLLLWGRLVLGQTELAITGDALVVDSL